MSKQKIQNALISAFNKEGLEEIVQMLHSNGVIIYSTGETASFIQKLGIPVILVSDLTGFPEILGGRVKTLHPNVFGGILAVRDNPEHVQDIKKHNIPLIDLLIVDLYPFLETLKNPDSKDSEIIEKIDIGGVALLRAAAKNFEYITVFAGSKIFPTIPTLFENGLFTTRSQRFHYAARTFAHTAKYEHEIDQYFNHYVDKPNENKAGTSSTGSE